MRHDLIEPMLELNRFAALEQVEREEIDLAELGESIGERFLRSHGVQLPIEATGSWFGHRESLQRILVILLDNSLKYAEETRLHLKSDRIEVRDRGPILSDDVRNRLFDRFYRLDEARDRSGSGLGLAIAKEVADLNEWTIGSRSNHPDGSIFFLTR